MKKNIIIIFTPLVLFILFCILYYFDVIVIELFKLLKIMVLITSFSLAGFFTYQKKIKYSQYIFPIIYILISFILSIIFKKIDINLLLYYSIILFSSWLGAFIKKEKKVK